MMIDDNGGDTGDGNDTGDNDGDDMGDNDGSKACLLAPLGNPLGHGAGLPRDRLVAPPLPPHLRRGANRRPGVVSE